MRRATRGALEMLRRRRPCGAACRARAVESVVLICRTCLAPRPWSLHAGGVPGGRRAIREAAAGARPPCDLVGDSMREGTHSVAHAHDLCAHTNRARRVGPRPTGAPLSRDPTATPQSATTLGGMVPCLTGLPRRACRLDARRGNEDAEVPTMPTRAVRRRWAARCAGGGRRHT